jgi:hypothetical protein
MDWPVQQQALTKLTLKEKDMNVSNHAAINAAIDAYALGLHRSSDPVRSGRPDLNDPANFARRFQSEPRHEPLRFHADPRKYIHPASCAYIALSIERERTAVRRSFE